MNKLKSVFVSFAILLYACSAMGTNYYVSSLLGNNNNPGSSDQPFATLQRAANLTNPGDTVFAMNGTYNISPDFVTILKITRSGTASQPIVYKNFPGHRPQIDFNVWTAIKITDGASYIVVDGFKIRGNNRNVNLIDATNQPQSCDNPTGSPSPLYNGSGVDISGGNPHHVTIRNCEVFECGGAGIGEGGSDYVIIENNLVYNNCWYTRYGNSGISINSAWNYDDNVTDFKIIVRNNIVYGNRLFVKWRSGTVCQGITDGNGIIFDVNRNSGYTGKFLAENNICYRNGGRGIHVYKSDNVTVRNNTTFKNCTSPELSEGEITVVEASNVQVYNNIMYAIDGERVNTSRIATNLSENHNIIYNSSLRGYYNANDIIVDPMFADTANNDFRLTASSPAINMGNDTAGKFSLTDVNGIARPIGGLPDMGAYEYTGTPAATVNFQIGNIAVLRVGDGISVPGNDAAAVNLLEYDLSGVATGINIVLSNALSTAPNRIVLSGNNTTAEGQLNLSPDGRYLSVAGYEGSVGDASTIYQANDKVIARISYNGTADYSTRLSGTAFNRTIRAAVTENSNRYYVTATNAAPASGNSTRFLPFGSPNTVGSTAFNGGVRSLAMFKGQVYFANNNTVGSLTPNPANSNYATNVPFPGVNISGHNYQSMVLLDMDATASYSGTGYDVLYCADQTLGLVKFYWNGATWVLAGTFNPASETGIPGGLHALTARLNRAGNPEIYAVKGAASNNNIIALTDISGFTGSILTSPPAFVNIASAGANYMFRGVAFTPSQTVITLPVDLLSFKGFLIGNAVLLNWATSSEINAKDFVVERSVNGVSFSPIGSIEAKNTLSGSDYAFTDKDVKAGQFFYRLKSVDKDGSFQYSKIILIKMGMRVGTALKIFPNPVKSYFSVSYPAASANASLSIFMADGKRVGEYNIATGSIQRSIDVSELGHGLYIIVYKNNNQTITSSFMK